MNATFAQGLKAVCPSQGGGGTVLNNNRVTDPNKLSNQYSLLETTLFLCAKKPSTKREKPSEKLILSGARQAYTVKDRLTGKSDLPVSLLTEIFF